MIRALTFSPIISLRNTKPTLTFSNFHFHHYTTKPKPKINIIETAKLQISQILSTDKNTHPVPQKVTQTSQTQSSNDWAFPPSNSSMSRRHAAESLTKAYFAMTFVEKQQILTYISGNYFPDQEEIRKAVTTYNSSISPITNSIADSALLIAIAEKLRSASTPKYEKLFTTILSEVPNGMEFIVQLRSDLRQTIAIVPVAQLKALDQDLHRQLSSWFSSGILELRRITWSSTPASIIEQIAKHEAVHPVQNISDLKVRLGNGNGRRCFGFFHPSLPSKPLVFVHVALTDKMSCSMSDISDYPTDSNETAARAAMFYSINSTKPGLAGVELGNSLIKRVAVHLKHEFPKIKIFSTLSPIPRFKKWIVGKLGRKRDVDYDNPNSGEDEKFVVSVEEVFGSDDAGKKVLEDFLSVACRDTDKNDNNDGSTLYSIPDPIKLLLSTLENTASPWYEDTAKIRVLKPILLRLSSRYLLLEKSRTKPLDGVAKFHLGNGARLQRVNFLADFSAKGLDDSYGLMVNYCYDLGRTEGYQERFLAGEVCASEEVKALGGVDVDFGEEE